MLPFFAWKIFSISFFISLDFYLQVLMNYFLQSLNPIVFQFLTPASDIMLLQEVL